MKAGAGAKQRLDQLLVERGLTDSREKARRLILAGSVLVNGQKRDKPGESVSSESRVELLERPPFVGRGGLKLESALRQFAIDVAGRVCLDVGASTGGFTDCLLQRGAARVHAIDVGAGQLDWKLRNDPRVKVREGLNARHLSFDDIGEKVDLAVCDVSFISVTMILPAVVPLLREGGEMVILVKPQFEVGRGQVGKGGIVRDPELRQAACSKVEEMVRGLGFQTAVMECPVPGAEGNREFLLHARR
jgi:23S rRNA (cytidine1920-2'-O)/16S rRNA (cytidine1409-2'-O)-methyltransferase